MTMTTTPMTTNYDYDYDYHNDLPLVPISRTLPPILSTPVLSTTLNDKLRVVIFFFCSFLLISHSRSCILLHSCILSHLHSRLTVGPVLIVIKVRAVELRHSEFNYLMSRVVASHFAIHLFSFTFLHV